MCINNITYLSMAQPDPPCVHANYSTSSPIGVLWALLSSHINYPCCLLDSFLVLRHANVRSRVLNSRVLYPQHAFLNYVILRWAAANFVPLYGGVGASCHLTWQDCWCTYVNSLIQRYHDCCWSDGVVWRKKRGIYFTISPLNKKCFNKFPSFKSTDEILSCYNFHF